MSLVIFFNIADMKLKNSRTSEAAVLRCSTKRVFLKTLQNVQKNTLPESLFNKVAGLRVRKFIKKRFQHRCFPVNFAKFLRPLFVQNTSELLQLEN